jgi:hypothetical protein
MVEDSINELKDLNDLGVIDPHSNYATGRAVYIISGDNDPTVPPENQDAQLKTFLDLGMPADKITLSRNSDKHGFLETYSGDILSFLWEALDYGELQEGSEWDETRLTSFDQREFFPSTLDWETNGQLFDRENGLVYIP